MTSRNDPPKAPEIGTHTARAGDQAPSAPAAGAERAPVPGDLVGVDEFLPMAIPASARQGAGRPVGSVNIRTNKTFQIAVSRYGDPLIASIAWGNMETRKLITELRAIASDCGLKLGATVMDVVRFQEQCRAAAMPYGHAKRAATDEKGDTVVPVLGLGLVVPSARQVAGMAQSMEDIIDVTPTKETQPNQTDSGASNDKSHGK